MRVAVFGRRGFFSPSIRPLDTTTVLPRYTFDNDAVKHWNAAILKCENAKSIMHAIFEAVPRRALNEPLVWSTVLNVLKRHRVQQGFVWVLNEVRDRSLPLTEELISNLLSAWGTVGRGHRSAELWTVPELARTQGMLRATLLSVTAVALGRSKKNRDEQIQECITILTKYSPLDQESIYNWGRLMHSHVLAGEVELAVALFRQYQSLLKDVVHTPASLFNVIIRGYGDISNMDAAIGFLREYVDLQPKQIKPEMEIDLMRSFLKGIGITGALEFLRRQGDPVNRPQAFRWLVRTLLDGRYRSVDDAKIVFAMLKEVELSDAVSVALGQASLENLKQKVTEDMMRGSTSNVNEETLNDPRRHRLWTRRRNHDQPLRISWVDFVLFAPDAVILERMLRLGEGVYTRWELELLLRMCQAHFCVGGIRALVESRKNSTDPYSPWRDCADGKQNLSWAVQVLKVLWNVRFKSLASDPEGRIAEEASALGREILAKWPEWKVQDRPKLHKLYCYLAVGAATGNPVVFAAQQKELLSLLGPAEGVFSFLADSTIAMRDAMQSLVDGAEAALLYATFSALVEFKLLEGPYMEELQKELQRTKHYRIAAEILVALELRKMGIPGVLEKIPRATRREYWKVRLRNAVSIGEAREAFEHALAAADWQPKALINAESVWKQAAQTFSLVGTRKDLDELWERVPKDCDHGIEALLLAYGQQGEVERVREIWDEVSERQRNQTMVRAAYFDAIHTKRSSENFTDLKPKDRPSNHAVRMAHQDLMRDRTRFIKRGEKEKKERYLKQQQEQQQQQQEQQQQSGAVFKSNATAIENAAKTAQ